MALELLYPLAVIVVTATVGAIIARLLRQPIVVAYIIAGVAIGPLVLALVPHTVDITVLAELGVAFLLFVVGIESDFSKILKMKYAVILGAIAQVFITTLVIFGIMQLVGLGFIESVYLGLIFSFSSTVLVVKILSEKHQITTLHGRLMIGFLIIQDILVVVALPVLANIESLLSPALIGNVFFGIVLLFALAFGLNRFVLPKALEYFSKSHEVFYLLVLGVAFGFIYLSYMFNFSVAVGAFIAGISLSSLSYNVEAAGRIRALRDFFATIFFVSLGLQVSAAFVELPILATLAMFAIVYLLNPLIFFLITLFAGYGSRIALRVGFGLEQVSEFSFIIAAQGLALGVMHPNTYSIVILVTIVSMASTPYMYGFADKIHPFFERFVSKKAPRTMQKYFKRRLLELESLPGTMELKNHVIVFGAGVFGGQIIEELKQTEQIVVVDNDPTVIEKYIAQNIPAVYGSTSNPEVWEKVALDKARIAILSIYDVKETSTLISEAKERNQKMVIFARAHSFEEALEFYEKNADYVVLPEVLGSNEALKHIIDYLQTGKMRTTGKLREEYIEYLHEKIAEEKKESRLWHY